MAITVAAMSGVIAIVGVAVAVGLGVKVAVIASGAGVAACNVAVNAGVDRSGVARGRQPFISQMYRRTKNSKLRFIHTLFLTGK